MAMLSQVELENLVELYPVLGQLSAADRTALRSELQPVRISAGTVLFDLDSPCTLFLLLASARCVVKLSLSGREIRALPAGAGRQLHPDRELPARRVEVPSARGDRK